MKQLNTVVTGLLTGLVLTGVLVITAPLAQQRQRLSSLDAEVPQTQPPALRTAVRDTSAETLPLTRPVPGAATSATVQAVNPQAETITLKTHHVERVELRAPASMLHGLQVGDVVEVTISGKQVTEIRKKE